MATTAASSNLTAALIDLASADVIDSSLYGGSQAVSYFIKLLRKATWFAVAPVVLSNLSTGGWQKQLIASVSRGGDYLIRTWLRATIPSVTISPGNRFVIGGRLRWTRNLMHNLVDQAWISFNDLVAHTVDSVFFDQWAAFTVPAGKRNGYNNMIGNYPALINPTATGGGITLPAATLNLPIPFFYTRDTGVSLPTAGLTYNDIRINITFRDWTQVLILDNIANGVSTNATAADVLTIPTDPTFNIWTEYAVVSGTERKRIGATPRDILIEQTQNVPPAPCTVTAADVRTDIRFSHPIKCLFFGIRNITNQAERSNYTCASPVAGVGTNFSPAWATDPINDVRLLYDSNERLSHMTADYFSLMQPYYNAIQIPLETGYHLYSYSMDIVDTNPKGSTNYGKLTNVQMIMTYSPNVGLAGTAAGTTNFLAPNLATAPFGAGVNQSYEAFVIGVNHNLVRIKIVVKFSHDSVLVAEKSAASRAAANGSSARLSNCGNTLRAFATKHVSKDSCGRGNTPGYGKNAKDWAIRSQVLKLRATSVMHAVQRLNVNRLEKEFFGFKIESRPRRKSNFP